jgi:hypothetical protein
MRPAEPPGYALQQNLEVQIQRGIVKPVRIPIAGLEDLPGPEDNGRLVQVEQGSGQAELDAPKTKGRTAGEDREQDKRGDNPA